jgi:DNA mismatch endonuclease, patch repair protein
MTDKLTAARRSENMRRIRSTETKPEIEVRRMIHRLGLRFRLHAKELPGKPDIVRRPHKQAIFVHGCFWHRHPLKTCRDARPPKTNTVYWGPKLARNAERDVKNLAALRRLGWRVLVIWACELKTPLKLKARLRRFFALTSAPAASRAGPFRSPRR